MAITAIRGFNDILPGDSDVWRRIEKEAVEVFVGFGFSEIKIPVVERTELFLRSIGQGTDIVEKEMYTFCDRRGESLSLRPEGTASVVRAYIEHRLYERTPVCRLFYSGPMFRYERPQKGRYRQFYQIGAEVLGEKSPKLDAEILQMVLMVLERLGLKDTTLYINSLGCTLCRPPFRNRLIAFLEKKREGLCEDCNRRMGVNPLRVLDCKNSACIEAITDAPSILDSLCDTCREHFSEVRRRLELTGIDYTVNPRMVRGLDYYTRTAFEITSEGLGAQNAIVAGGRYDNLVKELGGPDTPCFGFAMGVERIALVVKDRYRGSVPLTVFIPMGDDAEREGIQMVGILRDRGIRVVVDYRDGSLKGRMRRADRLGARFVIILGEDELRSGVVTLRDMESGLQERVSLDLAVDRIQLELKER